MDQPDDLLDDLIEALRLSPDNVTLRDRVGDLLLRRGRIDDADRLYREGVKMSPASDRLRLGLARCACQQGRHSEAMVIVEALVARPGCPPEAHLLHSRLLLRGGELERAAAAYRRAVALDPGLEDDELRDALGVARPGRQGRPGRPGDEDFDAGEVDPEGRLLARDAPPRPGDTVTEIERPVLRFADVGGMEDLKDQIRMKIIHPQAHAEIFAAYGKAAGGGVLLYGPPGCG